MAAYTTERLRSLAAARALPRRRGRGRGPRWCGPRCGAPMRRYNTMPGDTRPAPACGRRAGHPGQHITQDAYDRICAP